jgi:Methyltransferase domain
LNTELISPEYISQLRQVKWLGCSGQRSAEIGEFAKDIDAKTVLDYGCGVNPEGLANGLRSLGFAATSYDPAVPGFDESPDERDLVICLDVLEHIEPDKLDNVLAHLFGLAKAGVLLLISTTEATKLLPDGRNAHLIVQGPGWWIRKIQKASGPKWKIARAVYEPQGAVYLKIIKAKT